MCACCIYSELHFPIFFHFSRSEYRLSLRADNADTRLTRKGYDAGIVTDLKRIQRLEQTIDEINEIKSLLSERLLSPHQWAANSVPISMDGISRSAWDLLETPAFSISSFMQMFPRLPSFSRGGLERANIMGR